MSTIQALQHAAETRRSIYTLNKRLPGGEAQVLDIVEHALRHTPSAFNSQSVRLVVLFGAEHEKLWELTCAALRALVPAETFADTEAKMQRFRAAAGSVLFFEDQQVIQALQQRFPLYADSFPEWSGHSAAMHQYAIWTGLAAAGLGANLQHYSPVIAAQVAAAWDIPTHWTLGAQLVFGGIEAPAGEKTQQPLPPRLRVHGL